MVHTDRFGREYKMTCLYETNIHNHTLVIASWKALLYACGDVFSVRDRDEEEVLSTPSFAEALDKFNEMGGTSIPYDYQDFWLKHYREMSVNPLTGTRVGKDHPAYHAYHKGTQSVKEWMKEHKDEVERIRRRNGL